MDGSLSPKGAVPLVGTSSTCPWAGGRWALGRWALGSARLDDPFAVADDGRSVSDIDLLHSAFGRLGDLIARGHDKAPIYANEVASISQWPSRVRRKSRPTCPSRSRRRLIATRNVFETGRLVGHPASRRASWVMPCRGAEMRNVTRSSCCSDNATHRSRYNKRRCPSRVGLANIEPASPRNRARRAWYSNSSSGCMIQSSSGSKLMGGAEPASTSRRRGVFIRASRSTSSR
jgi:hypothetical protein